MGWLKKTGNFLTFGALDRREAKSITKRADLRQDEIKEELDFSKEKTQQDLINLGELKTQVYSTTIQDFISVYNLIADVDLSPLKLGNNALNFEKQSFDMAELRTVSSSFKKSALVGGGLAVAGATAAYGAMGTVGVFATTATTGASIGMLSGSAASNATLAWLGGGALSAGGSGVAGGMVVLGGIALAPVAILGMFLGVNKGKQKLNEANNYSDEVDVLVEKIQTLMQELSQVRRGCHLMSESIQGLSGVLSIQTSMMNAVSNRLESRSALSKHIIDPIRSRLFKVSLLTNEEAAILQKSVNCASLLKQMLDKPLMNEEGSFMSDILSFIDDTKPQFEQMIAGAESHTHLTQDTQMLKAS